VSEQPVKPWLKELLLPLAVLLLLTWAFRSTDLDLDIARNFYRTGRGWQFADDWLWVLLYRYGMIPGVLVGLCGIGGLLFGLKLAKLRRQWRSHLLLVLLLAIGPGLLVNSVFKDHWGRSRPKQVIEFGGDLPYVKVWDRGESREGRSFPSGHAAIGFYTIAPYFVLRRRRRRLAHGFLIGGTAYGLLMGCGRMVQGGHFASDVLWAWGMVYLSGVLLGYLLKPEQSGQSGRIADP